MSKFATIKKGSMVADVYVLQAMLRAMQYLGEDGKPIEVTGYCDKNTVHAINEFQTKQRAYGYECGTDGKNDGIFGAKCWERMLGV